MANSHYTTQMRVTWFCSAILLFAILVTVPCYGDEQKTQSLTIAAQKSVYNSLIYVALSKGYWHQRGLDVTLKEFAVGRLCLEAVITGNAAFGAVSDFPVALAGLSKQSIFIVSTLAWGDGDVKVIARKDKGIYQVADLKGKTIATFLGTAPEYYLRQFLKHNHIDPKSIKLVNMRPEDMVTALTRGDIHAAVMWEPFAFHARKQLGENATVFPEKGLYNIAHNLLVKQDFCAAKPNVLNAVLTGLMEAQEFVNHHPVEAMQIVAQATELQSDVLEGIWSNYQFELSLKQMLVEQLTKIAGWAIESNIVPKETVIPDYKGFIYVEGLRSVNAKAVKF